MKLLLINTPINRTKILGDFDRIYNDLKMIPTGLAYLASCARRKGIEVSILDQYAECLTTQEMENRIRSFNPDLIGYGATTPNYQTTLELLRYFKKTFPQIKTVLGGIHPSIFPEAALGVSEVDFVLRGEAENSLPLLCQALDGTFPMEVIEGLSFRDSSQKICHNPPVSAVHLDNLPWPAYDLLPMHLYNSPSYTKFAHPVYQMIASRGCPNHCSYCINAAEPKIGALYRRRPVTDVIQEMEMLVGEYGAKQIQFWDPIFPLGKTHVREFCERLISAGLHKKIVWNSTTYANYLDQDLIAMMAKAGCRGLGFGIESGVPELLQRVQKRANLEQIRSVCRTARQKGIIVAAGFILGFPGETPEMTRRTVDFAKSLDLHYAQFSIMVPYPGTPLYQEVFTSQNKEMEHKPQDFERFNQSVGLTQNNAVYVPEGRTSEELKEWQKRAYREFYLRPKMLWLHAPHVRIHKIAQLLRSLFAILRLFFDSIFKKQTVSLKNNA